METKKTWEYVSLRAYPYNQALALPLLKDKQRKACPRRAIYMLTLRRCIPFMIYMQKCIPTLMAYTLLYIRGGKPHGDIKSTHADASCCITAVSRFKFARFDSTDSNVKKTSFRDWPYNRPKVSFHRCYLLPKPTHGQAYTSAKIGIIF